MIICEDVFRCEDIGELRDLAREFYIDNLANTEVYNDEVGLIKFSSRGYKKPISFSMDTRKLLVFPKLKEIIKNAVVVTNEEDRYDNTKNLWFILENEIYLKEEKITIRINIRQDANGKFYYDHSIKKPFNNRVSPNEYEPD